MTNDPRYQKPGAATLVFNRIVTFSTGMGISVAGSRVLEVRGRRSGQPRRTPVNLLTIDDRRYLVAARGETEWVRNVRAADGALRLILGRGAEDHRARELPAAEAVPVLRAYLRKWRWEVGAFFDGVTADSSDEDLAAAADRHPAFVLD